MHRDGVKVISVPALFGCSIDRQFRSYKNLIVVILKTFLNFYSWDDKFDSSVPASY